jgi:TRAP-type C4-dicarboxylate transport system permease small subunit
MLATLLSITYYGWEFAQINAVQLSAAMDIPMSWVYASLWLGMGLCVVILLLIRLGSQPDWTSGSIDEHP